MPQDDIMQPPPPPYRNQQRPAPLLPRSHHFCRMLGCRGDRVGAPGRGARNFGTTLWLGWFDNELVVDSPRGMMEGDSQRRERGRVTLSLCQELEWGSDGGEDEGPQRKYECRELPVSNTSLFFFFFACCASALPTVPSFIVFHFLSPRGF